MTTKLAYNPKTHEVIACDTRHAETIPTKDFDNWVRAIYFSEYDRLYFRFFKPDGDYYFVEDGDKVVSFDNCYKAKEVFLKKNLIKKRTKVLYWTTDRKVTQSDIRF